MNNQCCLSDCDTPRFIQMGKEHRYCINHFAQLAQTIQWLEIHRDECIKIETSKDCTQDDKDYAVSMINEVIGILI